MNSFHFLIGSVLAVVLSPFALAGAPYRPNSPDTVLVRLPRIGAFPSASSFRPSLPFDSPTPRREVGLVEEMPMNRLAGVVGEAREHILLARKAADPRHLGQARRLLLPWWTETDAPAEVGLLKAEIRQGLHDFPGALTELDRVLALEPRHPGAWLLKATLHQVRGDYDQARRACVQVARFADELAALTVASSLASLGPECAAAGDRLESAIQRHPDAPSAIRSWALATLGEIRLRTADLAAAEATLRRSLALDPDQPNTKATLADVLFAAGKTTSVIDLLEDATPDALRVRLARARRFMEPAGEATRRLDTELGESFALAALRGDDLHMREHARYLLDLGTALPEALRMARRNWEIQKEPADLELLVRSAEAAGDEATYREALRWGQTHQPSVVRTFRIP